MMFNQPVFEESVFSGRYHAVVGPREKTFKLTREVLSVAAFYFAPCPGGVFTASLDVL